ncbi:MAG: hypothetical protein HOW73_50285 [Polyangiaceae bacterium]|nr:hypothetical protein [Polyangiaceae bacterium]
MNRHHALIWGFLACSMLGCGPSPTEELATTVRSCGLDFTPPPEMTDEQAECANECLEFSNCDELQALESGEDWADELGYCLEDCGVELFSASAGPEITFGEDTGTLSTSAPELLDKPAGNPNPETLVGVFEVTGYGSEENPDQFAVLTNEWRMRREHRADGIALAIECQIEVGGGVEDAATLTGFVSGPIEVHDWGIRILEGGKDGQVYTGFGFEVECSVELVPLDMPYCLSGGEVPDGYSLCVTVRDGVLNFIETDGTVLDAGDKISN